MGMFDNIYFENDIPDPHLRDRQWQTKSLDNALLRYRVTAAGELMVKRAKYEVVEDPDYFLRFRQNVVAEWEEKVEHHGIIEAYCFQKHDDGSAHSVIYDVYFTHGRFDRLERREEHYPAPRRADRIDDPAPTTETQVGDYTLHLPDSVKVLHASTQGELLLVRLEYPGILNIRRANHKAPTAALSVSGRMTPSDRGDDQADPSQPLPPIIDTEGRITHDGGAPIKVLAENSKAQYEADHPYFGPSELTAIIAPANLLDH